LSPEVHIGCVRGLAWWAALPVRPRYTDHQRNLHLTPNMVTHLGRLIDELVQADRQKSIFMISKSGACPQWRTRFSPNDADSEMGCPHPIFTILFHQP